MGNLDELQTLWQSGQSTPAAAIVWRTLIRERQEAWLEWVTAEDRGWYAVAGSMGLITALAAWKAKYPWVGLGYGLMATTLALSAVATWMSSRRARIASDRSLREHLQALITSYDERAWSIRYWGVWAMITLSAGLIAVVMGIPGNVSNLMAWLLLTVVVAAANTGQALYARQLVGGISRKRAEAELLLRTLIASDADGH